MSYNAPNKFKIGDVIINTSPIRTVLHKVRIDEVRTLSGEYSITVVELTRPNGFWTTGDSDIKLPMKDIDERYTLDKSHRLKKLIDEL
jgi:hypothetical protein